MLDTGLALISLGVGSAVMAPLGGRFTDRYGPGVVAVAGSALTVATTLPFALLPVDVDGAVLQPLLFLRGLAVALAITPVITAAYATVAPDRLPDATTQVNILQRLGGAIGGAVFAVIVARQLPGGAEGALHAAFAWLTAASVIPWPPPFGCGWPPASPRPPRPRPRP